MAHLTPEFQNYFIGLASKNWGLWPDSKDFPWIGVPFTAYQEEQNGTVVKFDHPVTYDCPIRKTLERGQKFKVYPVSGKKPTGAFSALRK